MDIDDIIKIDVRFNRAEKTFYPGEYVTGTIIVTPYRNIGIEQFDISPTYKLKGIVKPLTRPVKSIHLANKTEWKGGIDYTFEFSFQLNQLSSYKSPNLSIDWFIETSIKLDSATRTEIRKLLGKNLQFLKMTNPDSAFNQKLSFNVWPENQQRNIVQKTINVNQNFGKKTTNGLLIAAIVIFVIGFQSTYMVLLAMFLGIKGLSQTKKMKGLISQSVAKLTVSPFNKRQFMAVFNVGNSYKRISKLDLNFQVLEEITSSLKNAKPNIEVLHSDNRTFHQAELSEKIETYYDYPDFKIPSSIILRNNDVVRFTWLIEIKFVYTNGKTFTSKETFKATWAEVKEKRLIAV